MKKKHRKAFGNYVRWIADEMGLRDWRFELTFKEPTPHQNPADGNVRIASCEITPGRRLADLTFDPDIRNHESEELRETVVHELTHCLFGDLWDQMRRDLLQSMGQEGYDHFIASAERNLEHGIDATAVALAQHMPLIDWKNTGDEDE